MKMSRPTYSKLKSSMHEVLVHNGKAVDAVSPDYDSLTMANMWTLFNHAHLNTRYLDSEHPHFARNGRAVEFTGEHLYDLVYHEEDLNDDHIETAFRQMIREWQTAEVAA